MQGSLTAAWFLSVLLVPAISQSLSALPEDLEGSGYDLDGSGSGSGSGDGSEQDEITNIKVQPVGFESRIFTANTGGGHRNTFHGSSGLTSEGTHWPARDDESGFVMHSSKQFWENKDVLAAIIAGGVIGVVIAAALLAVLIHKWQKKGEVGHFLDRRRASDEDYHKPIRDAVIV